MRKAIRACAGLQTAPNVLNAPLGSFSRLDNCVIRTRDLIEVRRGQARLSYSFERPAHSPTGQAVGPNTLALWRFDEASGSLIDAVAGNYTLLSFGAASASVAGVVDGARSFGGYPSGLQSFLLQTGPTGLRDALNNGDWTIVGWVNRNNLSANGNLFSAVGSSAFGVYCGPTGIIGAYGVGTAVAAPSPLSANGWHLCAIRHTHGTLFTDVWIDTAVVLHETTSAHPNITGSSVNYGFGRYADTVNTDLFAGLADDWAVYSAALSDAELLAIYDDAQPYTPTLGVSKAATFFDGSVLAHVVGDKLVRDSGTAFEEYDGDYTAPDDDTERMKFARAQRRLYFTTDEGVKRLESLTGTPMAAGIARPAINTNTSHVFADFNGYLGRDAAVAYRVTLARRDVNRREMQSAPSTRAVVRSLPNLTADAGHVVVASNVATVTFTTPHQLKPGDTVDLVTGIVGFLFPMLLTVATITDSLTITAPFTQADATSVGAADFAVGGAASVTTHRVDLHIALPEEAAADDILRVWRTETIAGAGEEPGEEMYLAYEALLTAADITAGDVLFADYTPDIMLGNPAYFATTQETIAQQNERPPLALDICASNGALLFGNVINRWQIDVTVLATGGSLGIQLGNTFTIVMGSSTLVMTATSNNTVSGGNGYYLLYQGGDVASDNELTALSLVAAINAHDSNDFCEALYISGPTDNPGRILIQETGVGSASPIGLHVNANGRAFVPMLPNSGNLFAINNAYPHRVYESKVEEPDAVPGENFYVVGEADDAIVRVVEGGGVVWVFKERSTWTMTNSGNGYDVSCFSPDMRLVSYDSPDVVEGQVLCLTNKGVVSLSSGGATTLSLPIDDTIVRLFGSDFEGFPMLPTLRRYGFGVAYSSERQYLLALPDDINDETSTLILVWNLSTQTWTKWPLARTCGVVEPVSDRLYLGDSENPTLIRERKQFRPEDFRDDASSLFSYSGAAEQSDGTWLLEVSTADAIAADVKVGASVERPGFGSIRSIIKSFALKSGDAATTVLEVYPPHAGIWLETGTVAVYAPIDVVIRWRDEVLDIPGFKKKLTGMELHFQEGGFHFAELTVATNYVTTDATGKPLGLAEYDSQDDDAEVGPYDEFDTPPSERAWGKYYRFGFTLSEAECRLRLAGLTLDFETGDERDR